MKYFIALLVSFLSIISFASVKEFDIMEEGEITWLIPDDGGTPRDPGRITRISSNEFHIQASFEDGGISALRHAVSRMDLICCNNSVKNVKVTLHIDLSDDGRRTDFDNHAESGMPLRNFTDDCHLVRSQE